MSAVVIGFTAFAVVMALVVSLAAGFALGGIIEDRMTGNRWEPYLSSLPLFAVIAVWIGVLFAWISAEGWM